MARGRVKWPEVLGPTSVLALLAAGPIVVTSWLKAMADNDAEIKVKPDADENLTSVYGRFTSIKQKYERLQERRNGMAGKVIDYITKRIEAAEAYVANDATDEQLELLGDININGLDQDAEHHLKLMNAARQQVETEVSEVDKQLAEVGIDATTVLNKVSRSEGSSRGRSEFSKSVDKIDFDDVSSFSKLLGM